MADSVTLAAGVEETTDVTEAVLSAASWAAEVSLEIKAIALEANRAEVNKVEVNCILIVCDNIIIEFEAKVQIYLKICFV